MPFGNPLVAGEELIRSAIKSENYSDGSDGNPATGWRITRNGDADFNDVNVRGDAEGASASFDSIAANTSLLYRGDELSDLFAGTAKGIVGFGQYNLATTPNTTSEYAFLRLDVILEVGRVYRLSSTPMLGLGTHSGAVLRYETPATSGGVAANPTLASPFYCYTAGAPSGNSVGHIFNTILYPPRSGTYKFLVSVISFNGAASNMSNGGGTAPGISFWVEDAGGFTLATGISDPLGVPVPTKTLREFQVDSNAFRTYLGNGSYDNDQFLYQGQSPFGPNGKMVGWCWFPLGSIGTPSIADMVGVPASDIAYFQVYLFYEHWFNSGGGTVYAGYHTTTAVPAIGAPEPGGGIPTVYIYGSPGRNVGQWVTLAPFTNGLSLSVAAGTFRGILTGDHSIPNGNQYYGYANACSIRAGYYK